MDLRRHNEASLPRKLFAVTERLLTSYELVSVMRGISDSLMCTAAHAFTWNATEVRERATISSVVKSRSPCDCISMLSTDKKSKVQPNP